MKINESYTEFLALLFNSFIKSFEVYNQKNIILLNKILNDELKFSLFQISKILNHYNYKTCNKFFSKCNSDFIIQESAIVEYYIFKTLLLFNLDKVLLEFYNNYTRDFLINDITKFKNTFIKLLIKNVNYKLINVVNYILDYIDINKINVPFFNTLDLFYIIEKLI